MEPPPLDADYTDRIYLVYHGERSSMGSIYFSDKEAGK